MKELIHIRNAEGDVLSAEEKENLLLARLAEIPSLIVALSGCADSAYLASAAHEAIYARPACGGSPNAGLPNPWRPRVFATSERLRLGLPRFALAVRHGSDARASWTRRTRRSSLARAWIPPVSRAAPRQARARGNIARRNAARTRARDGRHHGGPAENGRLHLCCPGP